MKTYGGVGVWLHFGARWRRVVSFMTWPLYFRERFPDINFHGELAGPRDGVDVVKGKFLPPSGVKPGP
jgi:hypothetical protein